MGLLRHSPRALPGVLSAAALLLLAACGAPPQEQQAPGEATEASSLTVYSGRNESLVGPLLERFREEHDVQVEIRYGETAELAATLMEEGERTPAHVFISQDAGALGALAGRGLFQPLPQTVLARVPARFADREGRWVGLSGRARSVVYNTELVSEEELPQSLREVTDPRFKGRFGVAPLNGSFQAHMAVYHVVHGREALRELLAGIAANEPRTYPKNSAIVEAVLAGEVEWGLVNHYYLWRARQQDPDAPGRNFFMPDGEASSFINLAGAGILRDHPAAVDLVRFLLSEEGQTYFAESTFEYPLVERVEPRGELVPLASLRTPEVDFHQVSEVLETTLEEISASGLLP